MQVSDLWVRNVQALLPRISLSLSLFLPTDKWGRGGCPSTETFWWISVSFSCLSSNKRRSVGKLHGVMFAKGRWWKEERQTVSTFRTSAFIVQCVASLHCPCSTHSVSIGYTYTSHRACHWANFGCPHTLSSRHFPQTTFLCSHFDWKSSQWKKLRLVIHAGKCKEWTFTTHQTAHRIFSGHTIWALILKSYQTLISICYKATRNLHSSKILYTCASSRQFFA